MLHFFRAAGGTAAVLAFAAAVMGAQETRALDFEADPLASSYIDHASATLTAASFGSETAQAPAAGTDELPAQVDTHAEATVGAGSAMDEDSLAVLVVEQAGTETADAQQDCLANAVYFEARGEPLEGQLAVAEVILNRAASGRYPATLCGVITQKAQFSFVRDGRIPVANRASEAWRRAVAIARIAMQDLADSPGADAMFFHATYVTPTWRTAMNRIDTIGRHIFYR